jgi:hypothetical protein
MILVNELLLLETHETDTSKENHFADCVRDGLKTKCKLCKHKQLAFILLTARQLPNSGTAI